MLVPGHTGCVSASRRSGIWRWPRKEHEASRFEFDTSIHDEMWQGLGKFLVILKIIWLFVRAAGLTPGVVPGIIPNACPVSEPESSTPASSRRKLCRQTS